MIALVLPAVLFAGQVPANEPRLELSRLFALAAAASDEAARVRHLEAADRLAIAYDSVWRDPFLRQQVTRFRRWSPGEQRRKVAADSLRLAGNTALGRDGPAAALRLWRRSLGESVALRDSAGQAATLGNIGAGFLGTGQLDSAEVYLERSRRLADVLHDYRTQGNATGSLGAVQRERGRLARARALYATAAELRPRSGDTRGEAADRNNLGLIAQELGDWSAARQSFEAALAVNLREGRAGPAGANLTNLANLASVSADYPGAVALYRRALVQYRADENRLGAAAVLHDLGLLESRRGDYPRAKAGLLEALAIYLETGPVTEEIATRGDLAAIEAELGNLDGALGQLRLAETRSALPEVDADARAHLALGRADLAMLLNQPADAEHWFGRAGQEFRKSGDEAGIATAEGGLAQLQLLRDDFSGAQRTLEVVLRRQVATQDRRGAAATNLLLAFALYRQGNSAHARNRLSDARATYTALGDRIGIANTLGTLAELDGAGDNWPAAEAQFRLAIAQLGQAPAPVLAARLHAGLGGALRRRGAMEEAGRELRLAVASTEQVAGTLRLDERRAGFLSDKWDAYAELALLERARGRPADAFLASERLRARQTLDLLARGRIASPERDADSLAGREQDLRRRITELTRILAPVEPGAGALRGAELREASEGVREELAEAQRSYTELLQALREKSPAYARMVTPQTAAWSAVAARLRPDEALLEYLVTDSTTLVFVVSRDSLAVLDLGVGQKTLASLVDFTRSALSRPPSQRGPDPPLWQAPLRRLHAWLLAPVERAGLLGGKRALIVVPHAELHYLPFGALLDPREGGFVATRYSVSYAPSATVWLTLAARAAPRGPERVLALAPRARQLPGTGREVSMIQNIFGRRAEALVGAAATESAFRSAAQGKTVLHLATFGVLNKHNPLFSFVELSPSGHEDGRLEVHEVFGLALQARLVVLSACQTGLGSGAMADVPAGDDWVGLVHAFLTAGAGEVLATLWPVEDRTTARLMTAFYRGIAGGATDADALRDAQRAVLRDPATADPFYWAGFSLVGSASR
jgi:CHAT domain-containing protein